MLDLVADGMAYLVDAVGDVLLHRQAQAHSGRERPEHRGVEMPAGRGDGVSGRDDPGPVDPAGVDGLGQRHVQQVAAVFKNSPRLRTVVKPARSVRRRCRRRAACAAADRPGRGKARRFSPRPPIRRLTSMSMSPGRRVARRDRSVRLASAGLSPDDPDDPVSVDDVAIPGVDDLPRIAHRPSTHPAALSVSMRHQTLGSTTRSR